MKFSESWLRTLVQPALNSAELAHLLTMAGLEVEEQEAAAPAFTEVVIAEVLSVTRHENADRLNVCQVNVGEAAPLQIVCGAANVAAGLKVPCARIGAVLPGDFRIKQAKVRGVESFGMLCAASELGLAEASDGLLVLPADAPVGQSLRSWLDLDDTLLTLKLTPNRADCLSLLGLARDVAALTNAPLTLPAITPAAATNERRVAVAVAEPAACARYAGRVITGVNAAAVTPDWMKRRLERSGLRSISALVDVTNYVLLEQGQPLHAFDLDKLQGGLQVRFARSGETLALLNDKTITLTPDLLVIADDSGPVALAGIMGGSATAVDGATRAIFLESAFFAPAAIVGKARVLGFGSDSSHRFERGVDFARTVDALERATALVLEICGGSAGPVVEVQNELPCRAAVTLRVARANRALGLQLSADRMSDIFRSLGLTVDTVGGDLRVVPPSYRFDIEIEEDLYEELARVVGYEAIPATLPARPGGMLPVPGARRSRMAVASQLAARDYQEVINYAFVDADWEQRLQGNTSPVRLQNPIASQMSVMRSSLLGGLLATLQGNLNRKQDRVRVFEIGRCFVRAAEGGFHQPERLAGLVYGTREPEQWGAAAVRVDFFDIKGDVEALFGDVELRFEKLEHPALHPGRAARILLDGQAVGLVGELHPRHVQHYGLPTAPQLFEIELDAVLAARLPRAGELSRFQPVRRDIAVLVDDGVAVQDLLDSLKATASERVQAVKLFDVYRGKGVTDGQKSLAFAVTLQDTRKTLLDSEIDAEIANLIKVLEDKHKACLRK